MFDSEMIRLYDLKKTATMLDYFSVQVYRFRGDVPLVIRVYHISRQCQIFPYASHSPEFIADELRRVLNILEEPHWRERIQSLCMQKNTDALGTAELFADLY